MISLSIDVTKLDKSRFVKGAKGTYCDLVLFETPNGKYGDFLVKQGISKEDRETGVEMPILGNGKNIGRREAASPAYSPPPRSTPAQPDDDEPLPF